jgi:hypothetical protein
MARTPLSTDRGDANGLSPDRSGIWVHDVHRMAEGLRQGA